MKTPAMTQQTAALDALARKRNFALFMEQGTGKTWTILADAERLYREGLIDAVLVFAPNGVHANWLLREVPTHLEVAHIGYIWRGKPTTKKDQTAARELMDSDRKALRILTINVEAMVSKSAQEFVDDFIEKFNVLAVMDESKKIGNPKAKRTMAIIKAARNATARRILSGKPLTKAPMDLFSQFDFLKEGLLGTKSYRAFVAEYAVLLPPTSPQIQAMVRKIGPQAAYAQVVATDENGKKKYKNLEKLANMIAPHMFRVRKADCLDLPPKVYEPVYFELTPTQRSIYTKLEKDYAYKSKEDGVMSFAAIAARTKMKQVTSGFINIDGDIELLRGEENPRMEAFKDYVDNLEEPFIVWAIYREEIKQIVEALEELGISSVQYHGGISQADRDIAIDAFQKGNAQAFVCNKAAYAGLTLTAATTALYYSCDFDNDIRSQSEDRCHRIGTKTPVVYVDFIAEGTIDEDIALNLAMKNEISDQVIDNQTA